MVLLALLLQCCLHSSTSFASLGDSASSVEKDRVLIAGLKSTPRVHANYTVHEISNDGLTLREYLSSQGKIFAITWFGVSQPDLGPLLGNYYSEYTQTLANAPKIRGKTSRRTVAGEHLVVEKMGHLRAAGGRAYLPEFFPEGVDLHDLK